MIEKNVSKLSDYPDLDALELVMCSTMSPTKSLRPKFQRLINNSRKDRDLIADLKRQLAEARECIARELIVPGFDVNRWYYNDKLFHSRDEAIDAAMAAPKEAND